MTEVRLEPARRIWRTLRQAQLKRRLRVAHTLAPGAVPHSEAARRFWSRRTWSELAAVPAVSQVVLALVREGAPLECLAVYSTILEDESRHAELSRALADRLGGYDEDVPDGLDYSPRSLAAPSDVPLIIWALANGCWSETVSLALIRARFSRTRQRVIRQTLNETLKDEALHVRIGWQLASELIPAVAQSQRRELASYGKALEEMLLRTFATTGLRGALRRQEDAIRDLTARDGLGSLTAGEEHAVVQRALEDIWLRLHRLGVRRPGG